MFDPIVAPDVHRGPATGHTTEFGTTWQEAVARINAAFKEIFEQQGPASGVSQSLMSAIEARFSHLEEVLSDAMFKLDNHERHLIALTTPAEAPPIVAPVIDPVAADPVGVAANVATDQVPVTPDPMAPADPNVPQSGQTA